MMFRSIKSKIVVFALLATLIPSLGLGLLSFRQNEAQISDNVTRELRGLTSYASREIELWIDKRGHEAHVTSASSVIIEGLMPSDGLGSTAGKNPAAVSRYLRAVQDRLDTILELTVVNTAGQIVASSAETPAHITIPSNWPRNRLVAPPHWDRRYSTPTLSIGVPVFSYGGVLIGTLVAVLNLQDLQPYLKSPTKSPPGEVILLDLDGRTLVSSRSGLDERMQLDPSLLRHLSSNAGSSTTFQGLTHRQVIGLAEASSELPLTILAERGRGEVYGDWIGLRNMFLGLVGAVVLVVAIVAYLLGRSIVVPLQRLILAADRIADGDLEVRLNAARDDELGHLTRVFNEMADRLRHSHAEIMAANDAMQQQNQVLETLSMTDSLTGLYNRTKLDAILTDQLARFERNHRPFTLLMLDIDPFTTINDTQGHVVGDEILVAVAQILLQSIRSIDHAARYGGDEFIIILFETSAERALTTAERIRSQVEYMHYATNGATIAVTVSIGIVESRPGDMRATALLARVDSALYEAKRTGRNRAYAAL